MATAVDTGIRRELAEARAEAAALRAQVEGDPSLAKSFYQRKSYRQTLAADRAHSRLVRQRFELRTLNELGRGLTREEWLAARNATPNGQVRDRIGDPEPE